LVLDVLRTDTPAEEGLARVEDVGREPEGDDLVPEAHVGPPIAGAHPGADPERIQIPHAQPPLGVAVPNGDRSTLGLVERRGSRLEANDLGGRARRGDGHADGHDMEEPNRRRTESRTSGPESLSRPKHHLSPATCEAFTSGMSRVKPWNR